MATAVVSPAIAGGPTVSYGATIGDEATLTTLRTKELEQKARSLDHEADDLRVPDSQVRDRAQAMFDGVTQDDASAVGGVVLRGWDKPDFDTNQDVDGMLHKVRSTISSAKAPPAPELDEARDYGESMRGRGLMGYDEEGALGDGTLGVYMYTKSAPIGIYYNRFMRVLQAYLGDQFAAATAVHEAAHSRDHAQGRLSPRRVKDGEKLAYQTEYWWLKTMDPKGHKLAWARVTFCGEGGASAPKEVCSALEHYARIQHYGDRGDYDGLVVALGYQDNAGAAWGENLHGHGHFAGDGHQH